MMIHGYSIEGSGDAFLKESDKVANWYERHLSAEGRNTASDAPDDVAVYYKLPTMLFVSGKTKEAHAVLKFIQFQYMLPNGDFRTNKDIKTQNIALNSYYSYINGWIAMAAQRMGRFDIARKAYDYLQNFTHPDLGGTVMGQQYQDGGQNEVDIFLTAHLGLANLYFGDTEKARKAGELIKVFISKQQRANESFYLRMNDKRDLITEFPDDSKPFYVTKIKEPGQLYFLLGYPVAFLAKLFQATGDATYIENSKFLLDLQMTSNAAIYASSWAHKVAWSASIVGRITNETKYATFARKIADFLVTLQDDSGLFLPDATPLDRYDQSAELGLWLREIHTELNLLK